MKAKAAFWLSSHSLLRDKYLPALRCPGNERLLADACLTSMSRENHQLYMTMGDNWSATAYLCPCQEQRPVSG